MKKKVLTMLMAGAMMLSCFTGMTMSVNAANTADTSFEHNNNLTTTYTSWREKDDNTKVYVFPQTGILVNYTVEGKQGTIFRDARSLTVQIPIGVKGSITNRIKEDSCTDARLRMESIGLAAVITKGVWSPDSTRNYTVFP